MNVIDLILHQRTFDQFGYWPCNLLPSSNRKIIHKCDVCGREKKNVYEHFFVGEGLSCLKCKYLKQKKTNLQKYGVENVSQSDGVKNKKKQTSLKHFGVEYPRQRKEARERHGQICKQIYEDPVRAQTIKDKKKQTSLKHFGVEYPCQCEEIRDKQASTFRRTWLKKHGVENVEDINQASLIYIRQEMQKEQYTLLSTEYRDTHTKLRVQCPQGDIYWVSWCNYGQGYRCPMCNESRGERELKKILEQLYPGKVKQYDGLGFLEKQKVDFSVREQSLVFEFDGEQHYKPIIGGFNSCFTLQEAQERLRVQKKRDRRKNRLCKKNGYKVIRIRYDEELTLESVKVKIG
jgi:very-short-patch-repair endonuclease